MNIDFNKLQEEHGSMLIWALAMVSVTFLIYTGKIPATTIEYLLAWAAGQAYSNRKPKPTPEAEKPDTGE